MITTQRIFIFCLLICLIALGSAAYLQYVEGLEPCPMCIIQRWCIIALAVCLAIAVFQRAQNWGVRVYGLCMIIFSGIGGFVAGRQVWLQHLPPEQQPECGPGFDYLVENFPLSEALTYIFSGDGNCAIVDWTLFGQSLATWSLMLFLFFGLMGCWVLLRRVKV